MKSTQTKARETKEAAKWFRDRLDYDPETGVLTWKDCVIVRSDFRSKPAGSSNRSGKGRRLPYRRISVRVSGNRYWYSAHRVAWMLHYGKWPASDIDNIEGISSGEHVGNRISNLRLATRSENGRNKRMDKRNTSGCTGVYRHGCKKWQVQIFVDGSLRHIGMFNNIASAIAARKAAEVLYGYHPNHGRLR